MTNVEKEVLKRKLTEYLTNKDIDSTHSFRCLNPNHEDKNPSAYYSEKFNKVFCHVCGGFGWDIFDLIGFEFNLSRFDEQYKKTSELFGVTLTHALGTEAKERNYQWMIDSSQQKLDDTDYFAQRGISLATAKIYGCGYMPEFYASKSVHWKAVIIPMGENSLAARNTNPNASKADRWRIRGGRGVVNKSALCAGNYCFVTEGAFDAMALTELGYNAVAMVARDDNRGLYELIEEKMPTGTLIVSLDNEDDPKKHECTQAKAEVLCDGLKKMHVASGVECIGGSHKDIHDAFMTDPAYLKAWADAAIQACS